VQARRAFSFHCAGKLSSERGDEDVAADAGSLTTSAPLRKSWSGSHHHYAMAMPQGSAKRSIAHGADKLQGWHGRAERRQA
jgi:hypothetical protein